MPYPVFKEPKKMEIFSDLIPPVEDGHKTLLIKGPNIGEFPEFEKLPKNICCPVLLKVGDNISTDAISPAGAEVLPYRSNIPMISTFTFGRLDPHYYQRAMKVRDSGSIIVGGANYGQGSSREHAAISPRFMGVAAVIAKSFARIHRKNLINFGVLPLTFKNPKDYEEISMNDQLEMLDLHSVLQSHQPLKMKNITTGQEILLDHSFSKRELEVLLSGSLIALVRKKHEV
jgi:aconitate hydratase